MAEFFQNSAEKGTGRTMDAEWERWKHEILDQFVNKNKTLKELEEHMGKTHGFKAT